MNFMTQNCESIGQFLYQFLILLFSTSFNQLNQFSVMVSAIPMPQVYTQNSILARILPNILPPKFIYANGKSEASLPDCGVMSVCNKVDVYDKPWIEKQCKCKQSSECSTSLSPTDGFTIMDRTRFYKLCEPVQILPKCRYFRDVTWTLVTKGDNLTQHIVHCECPTDSVAYMIKRQAYHAEGHEVGFKYSFACSPQTRLLCQRKEPCRLFSLKRRSNVTDVNTSTLCHCPNGFTCPSHHQDAGVITGKFYPETMVKTFSGYCVQ